MKGYVRYEDILLPIFTLGNISLINLLLLSCMQETLTKAIVIRREREEKRREEYIYIYIR